MWEKIELPALISCLPRHIAFSPDGGETVSTGVYLYVLNALSSFFPSIWKRWEYQTTLPAYGETCMHDKKQQVKLYMKQWAGSKLGKEYVKAVYCYPVYLTYMQSTSWQTLGWRKHKLESRLSGELAISSDMKITWNDWNSDRLYFLRLQKSLQLVTSVMKLKVTCSLEEKLWST